MQNKNFDFINEKPADAVGLFIRQVMGNTITYKAVLFSKEKLTSPYLIQTISVPGSERYYPVSLLLDGTPVPYYAVGASLRLKAALSLRGRVKHAVIRLFRGIDSLVHKMTM